MAETLVLARKHTAVLIMDFQNEIVSSIANDRAALTNRAASVLQGARNASIPVIYVVVCFRKGYPEVSPRNHAFARLLESGGRLQEGTEGAEVHADVTPHAGDVVVTKRRVGAFSTTDLEAILRAKGIDTLVLLGISTSGVVLSTVRWAADMDYRLIVLADCCADQDEEVHRVLLEKVFPRQANVVLSRQFLLALGETGRA